MARVTIKYLLLCFGLFVFYFFITNNIFAATSVEGPFYPCAGVTCGPNSYCFEGSCKCSAGLLNCDGVWENGCECGGLNVTCTAKKCACKTNYRDCDSNMNNGCEVGGACPPCSPGQTRVCSEGDICNGKQTCDRDGYWGACIRTIPQICTPNSTVNCTPTINGKKCSALADTTQCNSCGSKYGACPLSPDVVCCPDDQLNCKIGECEGTKTCSIDGKKWGGCGYGDTICCAQDADCNDFNECTREKCADNKCEYFQLENCQSINPVRCKSDSNCASTDSCVSGFCSELKCNEEFTIVNHKCVCNAKECNGSCYLTDGVCCDGHWNEEFDSCFFDFGYYDEKVSLAGDKEAQAILEEAKSIVAQGDLRKVLTLAKIASTRAEVVMSTRDADIKNRALIILKDARDLLDRGNYSLALNKADEALNLIEGKGVQAEVEVPTLWQKSKVPIIIFSSIIVVLVIFIFYIIIVPKI